MPDEPIIQMREVRKSFGDHVVLDDLDLDVAAQSRVALIGSSGSGKSTILRILMGLEPIDSGTVEIDGDSLFTMRKNGREVPASRAHQRRVRGKLGMVFQQFNLFPHMTVMKNLTEAPRHVLGLSKEEAAERALELLRTVGLEALTDRYPGQLSGGQQQRVAIARALAMQPKIMLFDEVTSALDPELVGDVLGVLRTLARQTDMTMLLVTHQMGFAGEFADRVVFLDRGRIVEDGPPEQIFTAPEEERTREFLRAILEAR